MNHRAEERRWLWRGAAVLLGLSLVAALELGLRAWPALDPPPLTVALARRPGQELRSINAEYAQRFFSARYQGQLIASGRMAAHPFLEPLEPRPYRILFLGDSTVQGFPHPGRLAAAAFLEAMLGDAWPERPVEVFNLGITSIASFAVARVLEDAVELAPDLVVVYAGHNEFYGVYGVDGHGTWRSRLHYALGQLRLARLLERLLDRVRGRQVTSTDLLRIMSERGEVAPDSPRRAEAAADLRANLRAMAATCRAQGAPLVLCTLVANDAGFAPARSAAPSVPTADSTGWSGWVEEAARLLAAEAPPPDAASAALVALEPAAALDSTSAWLCWLRGRALVAVGRGSEARAWFLRARDLDLMPWRAPSQHNAVIRQVAQESRARLAEVDEAFRRSSPPEGVGWDLMADHLHPSVAGQAVLARAVLAAIDGIPGVGPLKLERVGTDGEYRDRLGDLPVERVKVDQAMGHLLSEPPMDRYNQVAARALQRRAAAGWQGLSVAEQRGARAWGDHRDEVPLVLEVADQLMATGDLVGAARHYAAARRQAPYTPRGDLWAGVQRAWIARLVSGVLDPAQEAELRQVLDRSELVAQAPGLDPYFVDLVAGTCHHFLGQPAPALERLSRAFGDPSTRRRFAYSLFPALAEELLRAGRSEEARADAARLSEETANPYFRQLVETLAQGGSVVAPVAAAAGRQAGGTDR